MKNIRNALVLTVVFLVTLMIVSFAGGLVGVPTVAVENYLMAFIVTFAVMYLLSRFGILMTMVIF